MYKCVKCVSAFTRKDNLVRHGKTHTGIRFPCAVCPSTFSYKSHLHRHHKNFHGTYLNNIIFNYS